MLKVPSSHVRQVIQTQLKLGLFRPDKRHKQEVRDLSDDSSIKIVWNQFCPENQCTYSGQWRRRNGQSSSTIQTSLTESESPVKEVKCDTTCGSDISRHKKKILAGKREGTRHGYGIQIWPNGSVYEGLWREGKAYGSGRFILADGDVYEGEWVDDKAEGYGTYFYKDGTLYEGYWLQDKFDGKGRETWPDGSSFVGNYDNGLKNGYGEFRWDDDAVYQGLWKNSKMHGEGIFSWPDGRFYQGEYFDDLKSGFGQFVWPDGRSYVGQWVEGKMHGYGCMTKKNLRSGVIEAQVFGVWLRGQQESVV
jgi:hypothetical protein